MGLRMQVGCDYKTSTKVQVKRILNASHAATAHRTNDMRCAGHQYFRDWHSSWDT